MNISEHDIEAEYAWRIFKDTKKLQKTLEMRFFHDFIKFKETDEYFTEEQKKILPF